MAEKKIALVIYSLNMGGAEKVVSELSLYFARQHRVYLILFDSSLLYYPWGGELIDLDRPSCQGTVSRFINMLQRAWRLKKIFKEHQFEHVFSFMENANFPVIIANNEAVVSNHCNPKVFSTMEWWFSRWLYPHARQVLAVSQAGMKIFQERAGLTNIDYLYNPVDLQQLQQKALEPPAFRLDGRYIVAVGRLSAEKDFTRLIKAYAASSIRQDYQLLILGEGDERNALEKLCRQLEVTARIGLPGFFKNPYPMVAQAEFLVLSSLHEGFPVVLLEALALDLPVIACDCETGPDEIIQHEQNGLLVPVGDTKALMRAMERLVNDPQLFKQLKQNARPSVRPFDIAEIAPRWLEL